MFWLRRLLPPVLGCAALAGALPEASLAGGCTGPLALLVDRSGSMSAHDPGGAVRRAFALALQRVRPGAAGDAVVPFGKTSGPTVSGAEGWPAAMSSAMGGEDEGGADLAPVLGAAGRAGRRLIVLTDDETALRAAPPQLAAFLTVGGEPTAAVRRAAAAVGAIADGIEHPGDVPAAVDALCGATVAPVHRDAVLVSGLQTTTRQLLGARSSAACRPADAFAVWCRALVAAGWRVSVVPAAPGRRGGAALDSTGLLDANGPALQRWLVAHGIRRPVFIGHSMGGLIAHAALRRGAPAAGLVTVGTPHAGSFGADAAEAAALVARACRVACRSTAHALAAAGVVLRRRFGAALAELTRARRTAQAPLGPPGVPLATWAGVPNRVPGLAALPLRAIDRGGYVSPNDGIVGQGSASGRLSGLSPLLGIDDGPERHSPSVPPRGATTELGSAAVAAWVAQAAGLVHRSRAGRFAQGRRRLGRRSLRPRQVVTRLRAVDVLPRSETAISVDPAAVIVATRPIGVLCDGAPVEAAFVVRGLWYVDVGAMGCRAVTRSIDAGNLATPQGEAVLVGATAPGDARLTVTRRRHGGWSVAVRAGAELAGRVSIERAGRRTLRLPRSRDEWGASIWRRGLGARGARTIRVRLETSGGAQLMSQVVLP